MKLYWILFIGICVVPVQGLFDGTSLQDFAESFIDAAKLKFEGELSLNDSAISHIWSFFKSKYNRVYSSIGEEKQRLRLFRDHLYYVFKSNFEKLRTFQLELNEFSDWTSEEFDLLKKGLIIPPSLRRDVIFDDDDDKDENSVQRSLTKLHRDHYHFRRLKRNIDKRRYKEKYQNKRFFREWFRGLFHSDKNNNHTDLFDWRNKSVVGSVENQRKCGCCYAIAAATIMETLYATKINSKNIIELSAQQITDCSGNGNNGCSGGSFPPSVQYLLSQGGKIATANSYPYAGKKQTCRTDGLDQISLGNIEFGSLPEGDEKAMAEALVHYGPLFIGLDAESKLFRFYKSGVLKIDHCPNRRQDMDHAMVVVGYGYDNVLKIPYWIIQNSWTTRWGENGYLRLAKDSGNMCGIASMAYYAKLT